MRTFLLLLLTMTALASTCDNAACLLPVVPPPAVVATVTQTGSGQLISGATLTLTDGVSTFPMNEEATGVYTSANGSPGTFTLTAQASGFQTVTMNNIVVTGQPCNVTTVPVQIQMDPV